MVLCPACSKAFRTWQKLKEHRKKAGHYYCYYCSEVIGSAGDFDAHNPIMHGVCPLCNFVCRDKEHLERHIAREHVRCFSCSALVRSTEELKQHFEDQHSAHCPHCYFTVADGDALLAHRKEKNHWFSCSLCLKEFATKEERDQHIRSSHWNCRYCERCFKSGSAWERHIHLRHNREFPEHRRDVDAAYGFQQKPGGNVPAVGGNALEVASSTGDEVSVNSLEESRQQHKGKKLAKCALTAESTQGGSIRTTTFRRTQENDSGTEHSRLSTTRVILIRRQRAPRPPNERSASSSTATSSSSTVNLTSQFNNKGLDGSAPVSHAGPFVLDLKASM